MEKISVVTICLNEKNVISRTINSVMNQTYQNIEYIIKDGGSRDETNRLIDELIEQKQYKYARHIIQRDTGIYDAMNQALKECHGEWIIFMNAGDHFVSDHVIEDIMTMHFPAETDILYGNAIVIDKSGESIWKGDGGKLPYRMPFSHQACMMKASLLKNFQFDTAYRITADFEMLVRCYEHGCHLYDTGLNIAVFDMTGISSTNYVKKCKEHQKVLKNHKLITWKNRIAYPFKLMTARIKIVIDSYFPEKIQIYLRKIYKDKIKKYQSLEKTKEVI